MVNMSKGKRQERLCLGQSPLLKCGEFPHFPYPSNQETDNGQVDMYHITFIDSAQQGQALPVSQTPEEP